MKFRELKLKCRINSANNQINVSLPRKKLSMKDLDKIQKDKSVKFLMEDNE